MSQKTRQKILVCGGTGFLGRNLVDRFAADPAWELYATYHHRRPPGPGDRGSACRWLEADLTRREDVEKVIRGMDAVVQAAATTSGAADIVSRPVYHVTDNAVMNSLLFRACYEERVGRVIFFSCSVMYASQSTPVMESDFHYAISDAYFGGAWTKVYLERMCEFFSRLGVTRYTAVRHSNIYGPHDKFDPEHSHVFGATVAKVMAAAENDKIVVWGDGSEVRDFLYVSDLMDFVGTVLRRQEAAFELVNVGSGKGIAVRDLVQKVIDLSGKKLGIAFDRAKPTIPFSLTLNIDRAKSGYGWRPRVSLEEGIVKTLDWYRSHEAAAMRTKEAPVPR